MPFVPSVQLTQLLKAWSEGDESALNSLFSSVYGELHRLAEHHMSGEREEHLLQPSALVNEAFVRLTAGAPVEWDSRTQFFGFSARIMRQILVDAARARHAAKRGYDQTRLDLSGLHDMRQATPAPVAVMDLNVALDELAALDARQAKVVELRYFGGLENAEIATVLSISESTVIREWHIARAWLFNRLRPAKRGSPLSPET
jgi:RNA polymerase sigma factor (TIGR02999 family)